MKITFLGAAENVTGSKFLVEHGSARIMIDAGLHQERELQSRNWEPFPVKPSGIQAVLLTHAHIDHSGYLPKLVKDGFRGPIYSTRPTAEITKISLLDAAKLQELDAQYKLKRHKREGRRGPHPEKPLYTMDDARDVFPLFRETVYGQTFNVSPDIAATYYDAGHILGSAMIELKVQEAGREEVWVFSGDIGRWDKPLLRDPHVFQKADYVVMEATYGNRLHEASGPALEKLAGIIHDTKKRGGHMVIPSFAINRAQEILYYLNQLLMEKRIPAVPVFVDSPMAADVTEVFNMYPDDFDEEAKEILRREDTLFDFPLLKMAKTTEQSKAINQIKGTAIILAGSGMCTGGRIKHHLAANISRPESTILFAGYQAEGTLGRTILERPADVRILGQRYPVRARIEKINGFSGHADQKELLRWVSGIQPPSRKIFIVHAEKSVGESFARFLEGHLASEVIVPQYLDEFHAVSTRKTKKF